MCFYLESNVNEQLKKAILEATRVEPWTVPRSIMAGCEYAVDEKDHNASQAKLLRVIEVLIEQRDPLIVHAHADTATKGEIKAYRDKLDAELIAALDEK